MKKAFIALVMAGVVVLTSLSLCGGVNVYAADETSKISKNILR